MHVKAELPRARQGLLRHLLGAWSQTLVTIQCGKLFLVPTRASGCRPRASEKQNRPSRLTDQEHDRLLISGYKLQMPIKDILFHIRDTADRGQMQSAVAAAVAQGDTDANRDDAIKRWLVRQYQSQSKLHVRGTE